MRSRYASGAAGVMTLWVLTLSSRISLPWFELGYLSRKSSPSIAPRLRRRIAMVPPATRIPRPTKPTIEKVAPTAPLLFQNPFPAAEAGTAVEVSVGSASAVKVVVGTTKVVKGGVSVGAKITVGVDEVVVDVEEVVVDVDLEVVVLVLEVDVSSGVEVTAVVCLLVV